MSTGDKIEANANLTLWCVHILGSDDIIAAPSHGAAETHAHELNKAVFGRIGNTEDILCFAYAAPWPHDKLSHANNVQNWLEKEHAARHLTSDERRALHRALHKSVTIVCDPK